MHNPLNYFNSSPEVIRLKVMVYIRYPLSFVAAVPPVYLIRGANELFAATGDVHFTAREAKCVR